jgi:CRISPR type II-A-associated protein Csn2
MEELHLTITELGEALRLDESSFFTLSIEHKGFLLQLLSRLRAKLEDKETEGLYLLLNNKSVVWEKSTEIIFDMSDINFNQKSIEKLLSKNFASFLSRGEQSEAMNNLESIMLQLMGNFKNFSHLNLSYNHNINADNLIKVSSLSIADDKRHLLLRLCEYVDLLSDLKPLKLLCLVFAKQFLSVIERYNLYKHCQSNGLRLLMIEGNDRMPRLKCEKRLIIDENFCLITQGY